MVPVSGCWAPESIFSSVDLPAPFSPSSAWISPGATSKSTLARACTPGKRLLIPYMRRRGSVLARRSAMGGRRSARGGRSGRRASALASHPPIADPPTACFSLHFAKPFGLVERVLGDRDRRQQRHLVV